MKEFFKQCLEDLESLTGIRQLYFLQVDADGKRKIEVLISGMITTSNQFPYISEDNQKKIIREMMVKDQDYDSLNSRTVYKWLNQNKDLYFMDANKATEAPRVHLSEEESKRIDQLASEALRSLSGDFKPKYSKLDEEMKKIQIEDKERQEGKAASGYIPDPTLVVISERKLQAAKSRGLDKLDLRDLHPFVIEGKKIVARNIEEAQEIYLEVYE